MEHVVYRITNMIKIWNSAKEVAINVFGDYEVVNGGGKTSLYDKLNSN